MSKFRSKICKKNKEIKVEVTISSVSWVVHSDCCPRLEADVLIGLSKIYASVHSLP